MKFRKSSVSALFFSAVILFSFSSCRFRGYSSLSRRNVNIDKTFVNFDNATSVGIVNKTVENSGGETKRNYLVTFDENNNFKEVIFLKDAQNESGEITQEQIAGEIDKCYVSDRFTFLRFTSRTINYNAYWRTDYYSTDYLCNNDYQSFAVDNLTGKVYSLESVGSVQKICKYSVVIGYSHYYLSADENGLRLEKVVNNPNVRVCGVARDKYGNTFVATDSVDECEGTTYYYNISNLTHNKDYALGTDGRMYFIEDFSVDYRINYFGADMNLYPVEDGVKTTMYSDYKSNYSYILKDNHFFILSDVSIRVYSKKDSLFKNTTNGFSIVEQPTVIDNYIFGIKERTNMLCLYDFAEYDYGDFLTEQEILAVKEFSNQGDYLLATVESVSETKKYKIWPENGKIETELYDRISYGGEVFTIQSLN